MKPDKKKELITTEEYQRPPLLEEIKKFKEELKLVSSFILFSAGVVAIIAFWNKVAFLLENISLFFGNVWSWIQDLIATLNQYLEAHIPDISWGTLLVMLVVLSTYLLKESTVSRHYIYNRYRIGHYSKMMWTFIGGGLVQLITIQRRYDLIPNVVNSVKGYMTHEEEVFKSIADARAKIGSNASAKEKTAAQGELDSAVSRLLVLTENYPTLRSNEQVQSLIVELEGTENRIYVARTDYNAAVTKYNKSIRSFPKNIIANSFGFKEKELVNATKDAQTKVPTVDLSNK